MSNTRRLRPPPTGYSFKKLTKIIIESDYPDNIKQNLLAQAAKADKKGRIRDMRSPLVPDAGRGLQPSVGLHAVHDDDPDLHDGSPCREEPGAIG